MHLTAIVVHWSPKRDCFVEWGMLIKSSALHTIYTVFVSGDSFQGFEPKKVLGAGILHGNYIFLSHLITYLISVCPHSRSPATSTARIYGIGWTNSSCNFNSNIEKILYIIRSSFHISNRFDIHRILCVLIMYKIIMLIALDSTTFGYSACTISLIHFMQRMIDAFPVQSLFWHKPLLSFEVGEALLFSKTHISWSLQLAQWLN